MQTRSLQAGEDLAREDESASHDFFGPGMIPTQRTLSFWMCLSGREIIIKYEENPCVVLPLPLFEWSEAVSSEADAMSR